MKERKRFLIKLLSGALALTATFALGSCDLSGILDQLTPTEHYHVWTDWKQTKAPTCDEAGEEQRKCLYSKCDIGTETREIEALGHNFIDGVCENCGVEQSTLDPEEGGSGEDNGDNEGGETDPDYTASVGLKYTLSNDKTYYMVSGIGTCTDTDIVIPSTYQNLPVTSIDHSAFSSCDSLTSVVIGDSVTTIGGYAFNYCTSLTSVEIPDSVTSIGWGAFLNCTSLTRVIIGDSVTTIDGYAFSDCPIESATIPTIAISYIPLAKLKTVVITSGDSIGDYAFYNCTSLTSVVIPDSVTSIGSCAFYNCTSLTSVVIPDSVTSIGNKAFYNCSALTSLVIGDSVTSIGEGAFGWCTSLTSVVIPDSVTSIGNFAFSSCPIEIATIPAIAISYIPKSKLKTVVITSGDSIGEDAFRNCSSLTSVEIPDSVASIGSDAFYGCDNLQYNEYDNGYYLGNENNKYIVLVKAKDTTITSCTIHEDTKFIHSQAFDDCTSLTSVVIPDSVTSIGDEAFRGCTSLTSVTFKNTEGWWRASSSTATSGTSISSTDLADSAKAATYLKSTYYNYYWKRS